MKKLVAVTLTCIIALVQLPLLAQGVPTTGMVEGTVSSNIGRRISGMTIQIRNAAGMVIGSTVTGSNGSFSVPALTAGVYTVECLSEKRQVLGSAKADLTPPSVSVSLTCTTDAAAWYTLDGKLKTKVLAAMGAAAVALSAAAVVSRRDDGSPSR